MEDPDGRRKSSGIKSLWSRSRSKTRESLLLAAASASRGSYSQPPPPIRGLATEASSTSRPIRDEAPLDLETIFGKKGSPARASSLGSSNEDTLRFQPVAGNDSRLRKGRASTVARDDPSSARPASVPNARELATRRGDESYNEYWARKEAEAQDIILASRSEAPPKASRTSARGSAARVAVADARTSPRSKDHKARSFSTGRIGLPFSGPSVNPPSPAHDNRALSNNRTRTGRIDKTSNVPVGLQAAALARAAAADEISTDDEDEGNFSSRKRINRRRQRFSPPDPNSLQVPTPPPKSLGGNLHAKSGLAHPPLHNHHEITNNTPINSFSSISDDEDHHHRIMYGRGRSESKSNRSTDHTYDDDPPNLHSDLANSAWPTLHDHIKLLSIRSDLTVPALTCTDPQDSSTPLHIMAWKAPPSLTLMLIRLLPTSRELNDIFTTKDKDANTAIHLCCANLEPEDNKEGIVPTAVLEALVRAAPRALLVQNNEGDTPLHLFVSSAACCRSNATYDTLSQATIASADKALTILLHSGKDATTLQDNTGATPLHVAIANGAHQSILLSLIDAAPMSCMIEDYRGMIPLHYVAAFCHSSVGVVRRMLSANNPDGTMVLHQTHNGDTPLHLAISNAGNRDGAIQKTLINSGGKLDRNTVKVIELLMRDKHSTRGSRHENLVVEGGQDEFDSGAGGSIPKHPLLVTNREKLTPLHCCALFDAPPQLTRLLMKHPIAIRAASMTNSFGATPLHLAAAQPGVATSFATVAAIGTAEAAAVQDRLRRTPLHVAAQNVHATSQLIKTLTHLNPDATTEKTQRGHLPLHLAAQSQAKESVIKSLIKAFPKATEAKNKSGNTPLHDAAKYRASAGVVRLLLHTYPEAVYIQNQYGNLPLHCATAYQAPADVVELLLQAWPDGASMQNRNQDAPLHYASAYATSADAVKALIDAAPAAVLLLNSSGQSPVDRAKANNAPEEIIELLEVSAEEWKKRAANDGWGAFSPNFDQADFGPSF